MRRDQKNTYTVVAMGAAAAMIAILFGTLFGTVSFSQGSQTANLVATANVQGVCLISLTPSVTQFGQISPSSSTFTNFAVTDNNMLGNTNANILLAGTNWIGSGTANFFVSNTLWNPTSLSSYAGNSLNLYIGGGNFVDTNVIATAFSTNTVYFGVGVPAGQAPANYVENIIFENQC